MDKELARFLLDIKIRGYHLEYASYHASNLIMQEGEVIYNLNLDNNNTVILLDFLIKLDAMSVAHNIFKRIVDDLIEGMFGAIPPDRTWLLFVLYKEDIQQKYGKYSINKITLEQFKASTRKYCEKKEDFGKLLSLAMKG